MKKLLLSIFVATSFAANAQVTLFEDSFETYTDFAITGFGGWITVDNDGLDTYIGGYNAPTGQWSATWPNAGDPQAFMVFNPSTATGLLLPATVTPSVTNATNGVAGADENRNFDPHTGSKFAACWAASDDGGSPVNNDLLISPVINLGATNTLKFWVKSMSDSYELETYKVFASMGTGIPADVTGLTALGIGTSTAPYPNWLERTFVLAPGTYDGQSVRFVIQCTSADHYMFMVDDFKVTAVTLKVSDVLANKFSVYPNPSNGTVNITNTDAIGINQIQITDLNGRIVKTEAYTATGDIQVNIADLASGMYLMNISSDQGTAVKKIMKN